MRALVVFLLCVSEMVLPAASLRAGPAEWVTADEALQYCPFYVQTQEAAGGAPAVTPRALGLRLTCGASAPGAVVVSWTAGGGGGGSREVAPLPLGDAPTTDKAVLARDGSIGIKETTGPAAWRYLCAFDAVAGYSAASRNGAHYCNRQDRAPGGFFTSAGRDEAWQVRALRARAPVSPRLLCSPRTRLPVRARAPARPPAVQVLVPAAGGRRAAVPAAGAHAGLRVRGRGRAAHQDAAPRRAAAAHGAGD